MFNQFDVTMKNLLMASPSAWLKLAGITTEDAELLDDEDLQFEETDLSTVTTTCDKVLRVTSGSPVLYHIEFESDGKNVPKRVLRYNVLVHYKYDLPVSSIVFLLRKSADNKEISGRLELFLPNGVRYHDFSYLVVRVWELPVERILESSIGLLPLALISDVEESELPAVVRRMQERAESELNPDERDLFWTSSYLIMGLNYPVDFIENLLKGADHMQNSSTYMGILNKGIEKGIEKGEEIGKLKSLKETILLFGGRRFGEPNVSTEETIQAIQSIEYLTYLRERIFEVETWEEFLINLN